MVNLYITLIYHIYHITNEHITELILTILSIYFNKNVSTYEE